MKKKASETPRLYVIFDAQIRSFGVQLFTPCRPLDLWKDALRAKHVHFFNVIVVVTDNRDKSENALYDVGYLLFYLPRQGTSLLTGSFV